jgi:hypothetical protein
MTRRTDNTTAEIQAMCESEVRPVFARLARKGVVCVLVAKNMNNKNPQCVVYATDGVQSEGAAVLLESVAKQIQCGNPLEMRKREMFGGGIEPNCPLCRGTHAFGRPCSSRPG